MLGAAVGSFLNVVVYRLPRRQSLLWPGSRCPACSHAIRAFDNVPVLGWLWLRGRCRDCRAPISARYPLIEAVVAGSFLLLGYVELFRAVPATVPSTNQLVVFAGHAFLLCCLLAGGMIDWDGFPWPKSLLVPLFLVGLIWSLRFSIVVPQNMWGISHPLLSLEPLFGHLVGALLGALLAMGIGRLTTNADDTVRRRNLLCSLSAIGLWLGSFMAFGVAATMCLLSVITRMVYQNVSIPLGIYPWAITLLGLFLAHL
jgi:leader peptidase (prepilin peptidase)/N-methyltransferase